MTTLKWNDAHCIGNPTVDEQHRTLFKAVNDLHDAIHARLPDIRHVRHCFVFLVDYVKTHFAAEENLLRDNAFPGLDRHAAEHQRLIWQLDLFEQRLVDKGFDKLMQDDFIHFLVGDWLLDHVVVSDTKYRNCLADTQQPAHR